MRFLLCLPFLFLYVSCSRSTAGLTIQPNQGFVLGEDMDADYRASVTNRGKESVTLQLVEKESLRNLEEVDLAPGSTRRLRVNANRQIQLLNESQTAAELLVVMNRGVDGMRTTSLDGSPLPPHTSNSWLPLKLTPNPSPPGPTAYRFASMVEPDRCFVVGESSAIDYSARIRVRSGQVIKVVIKDRENGEQTQGFGLGGSSREAVRVEGSEVLCLCNEQKKTVRIVVRCSRSVTGGRLVDRGK